MSSFSNLRFPRWFKSKGQGASMLCRFPHFDSLLGRKLELSLLNAKCKIEFALTGMEFGNLRSDGDPRQGFFKVNLEKYE
jgi:hypothetical protein